MAFIYRFDIGTKSRAGLCLSSVRFGTSMSLLMMVGSRTLTLFEIVLPRVRLAMLGLIENLRPFVFWLMEFSFCSPLAENFSVPTKVTFLRSGYLKVYPRSTMSSTLRLSLSNFWLSLSADYIFRFSSAMKRSIRYLCSAGAANMLEGMITSWCRFSAKKLNKRARLLSFYSSERNFCIDSAVSWFTNGLIFALNLFALFFMSASSS